VKRAPLWQQSGPLNPYRGARPSPPENCASKNGAEELLQTIPQGVAETDGRCQPAFCGSKTGVGTEFGLRARRVKVGKSFPATLSSKIRRYTVDF